MARSYFERLYGRQPRTKRAAHRQPKTFADYFATGNVLPYSLLCGLMSIAGMLLLTGIPGVAIAVGLVAFIVNYTRFGGYAPSLFRKIPFTLFKEIDKDGDRKKTYIKDKKRLTLIVVFIFGLSMLCAASMTFFSLSFLKDIFMFLGIKSVMSLGGFSLIPAFAFFGTVCFMCSWALFADGASNMFAREDFWERASESIQMFFGIIPDPSLLLPGETVQSIGRWMLARQIARLLLVAGALSIVTFGNYVVGVMGIGSMFKFMGVSSVPWGVSNVFLPLCVLIGGSVFITTAVTHLMTLLITAAQFTWNQYVRPIDYTVDHTASWSPIWRVSALTAMVLAAIPILVVRGILGFFVMEYHHIKDTLTSPVDIPPEDKSLFHDTDTLFERIYCNTQYAPLNFLVNALFITPLLFIAGVGIFLNHHIKLFATINAIANGSTAFNSHASAGKNMLGIVGYGTGSGAFGFNGAKLEFLGTRGGKPDDNEKQKLGILLFGFIQKQADLIEMQESKISLLTPCTEFQMSISTI